jgi:hypothetical protein
MTYTEDDLKEVIRELQSRVIRYNELTDKYRETDYNANRKYLYKGMGVSEAVKEIVRLLERKE